MFGKIVVTVPIYVYKSLNDLYDHHTLITNFSQDETCSRLLASIAQNKPKCIKLSVILFYGRTSSEDTTNEEIEYISHTTFRQLHLSDKGIDLMIAGNRFIRALQDILQKNSINFPISNIYYGNIRNLQLFVQMVIGNEHQINVDDDEIIPNEYFFQQLPEMKQYLRDHTEIGGIGGLYVDEQGKPDILSSDHEKSYEQNIYRQKEYLMQQMINNFKAKHWSAPAPSVFGGHTFMTQKLIQSVCYDPNIQRGEDTDFLINALFKGIFFTINNSWTIIHKPSGDNNVGVAHISTREKEIRDVKRFLFEQEKIYFLSEKTGISPEEVIQQLQPYPGEYIIANKEKLISDARGLCSKEELHAYIDRSSSAIG